MEYTRFSEELPHLFKLAHDQGTKRRVSQGGGAEVGADPLGPGRVEAASTRVQAGVHELRECDAPALLNEIPDLPINL
jgi:hypothetical protein